LAYYLMLIIFMRQKEPMQAIIIDDDITNVELVEIFIQRYAPDIRVIGKADNVEDGIEELIQKKPDLLFLDIQLHDQTGFDILESIQQPELLVIMITAHAHYATEAVRAKVNDYLLKPLSIKEFTQAINRIREEYTKRQSTKTAKNFISVTHKEETHLLPIDSIARLETQRTCTLIKTKEGKEYLSSKPLSHFDDDLPPHLFLRVHHSHIININEVANIVRNKSNSLRLHSGDEIPVSASRKKEIYARLFI